MKGTMDIEHLKKSIAKIQLYSNEEDKIFDSILMSISNISNFYKSNSTKYKNYIKLEFQNQFKVIQKNNMNKIVVFQKNIEKYQEQARAVASMFDFYGGHNE